MTIALNSPVAGAIVRSPSTRFIWAPEASPVEDYVLEVATDSGFSAVVSRLATDLYDVDLTLAPGEYYWRVTYQGDNPSGSPFTVAEFVPSAEQAHVSDGISRLLSQFKESE